MVGSEGRGLATYLRLMKRSPLLASCIRTGRLSSVAVSDVLMMTPEEKDL